MTPQAFEPRPNEKYLSVHWLEYFRPFDNFPAAFERLRAFLNQSRFQEVRPQQEGRMVALRVGSLRLHVRGLRLLGFSCRHCPRDGAANAYATGHGKQISDTLFDPHSGVYTMPWKGPELMAVQQYLLSRVVHTEVGKIAMPARGKGNRSTTP